MVLLILQTTCQNITFRTIIYDQRGTGRNTIDLPDSNNITMDLMVTDIENLRKKLKIQKWTVLGHSFGGLLGNPLFGKTS